MSKTKKKRIVADKYNGNRFNAPNDLVIDKQDGVYFTDPSFRAPKPMPQDKLGVYYVDAKGKVTRLIDNLPNPNGILLSVDGKTLYVIPTGQAEMMAYPIESPGKIGKGKVFCTLKGRWRGQARRSTGGDGATIDAKGNLYITSTLGLQVFDPDRQTARHHHAPRTTRQRLLRRRRTPRRSTSPPAPRSTPAHGIDRPSVPGQEMICVWV